MDKLDVVLAEYKALRDETNDKFRLHLQIYSIYTSSLLIFYGLIVAHETYDLILIIPIFSLALLFRILWEQIVIIKIGEYIHNEIEEKKIPILMGKINKEQDIDYTNLWMGWQHFWKETPHTKYYQYSLFMLFLLFSVVPAVLYNIYSILAPLAGMAVTTILPIEVLIFILIVNFSFGCYMLYKIIRME
jgi:hypothetical protein